MKIIKVIARQILDSRGNPTVECELHSKKYSVIEQVPSGASTGIHEALELRDNKKDFHGKSVHKAIKNIIKLSPKIKSRTFTTQRSFDMFLISQDNTENKTKLGSNAILALSLAFARLKAKNEGIPLYEYISKLSKRKLSIPIPFLNVINGGVHAAGGVAFQEFMIVPLGNNFTDSLRIGSEIYQSLKKKIERRYGLAATRVGDEGGFAPPFEKVRDALNILTEVIDDEGCSNKVKLALDVAASEFYKNGKYEIDSKKLTPEFLISKYEDFVAHYPIISIEDPFEQEDFEHFSILNKKLNINIVGDDLTVTNPIRIKQAIIGNSCTTLLLKVNQIGSLTEAIDSANLAFSKGWSVMVSHRSGETESTFIADLAVGIGCGMIKSGAPCRTERTAKYNRLIRIEEELRKKFPRKDLFKTKIL